MNIVDRRVSDLVPYGQNTKDHPKDQVGRIAASIEEFGFNQPVLVDADGVLVAGHGRVLAAKSLGLETVPTICVDHLTPEQVRAYRIADNKTAESDWLDDVLRSELEDLRDAGYDLELTGFDEDEIDDLLGVDDGEGLTDPDDVPEVDEEEEPVTRAGDVWVLGRHRVMCGSSTSESDVRVLLSGDVVDLVLMDPPYCSGGFQESVKVHDSVGTTACYRPIINDVLSTRGFGKMLKGVLGLFNVNFLLVFTDWRMWIPLFDVVESAGFGARSMIVWDKGCPGLGRGFRAQHELIMWAAKIRAPFDKYAKATGNVFSFPRSGNKLHTTQKPSSLAVALLDVVSFANVVADPFLGSGTTLIACEQTGRTCYGMELDPHYCDVIVKRWEAFTGKQAERIQGGK